MTLNSSLLCDSGPTAQRKKKRLMVEHFGSMLFEEGCLKKKKKKDKLISWFMPHIKFYIHVDQMAYNSNYSPLVP